MATVTLTVVATTDSYTAASCMTQDQLNAIGQEFVARVLRNKPTTVLTSDPGNSSGAGGADADAIVFTSASIA
jgi:hypothetical protein